MVRTGPAYVLSFLVVTFRNSNSEDVVSGTLAICVAFGDGEVVNIIEDRNFYKAPQQTGYA